MTHDPKHVSEEELNWQRKVRMESESHDVDGIIETIDRAFRSVVNPLVRSNEPDEDDLEERRETIDKATRES
jgi:hypothetical protein